MSKLAFTVSVTVFHTNIANTTKSKGTHCQILLEQKKIKIFAWYQLDNVFAKLEPEFWYHKSTVKLCEQPRQSVCWMSYMINQKSEVCCTRRNFHTNLNGLCVKHAYADTVRLPPTVQAEKRKVSLQIYSLWQSLFHKYFCNFGSCLVIPLL